MANEITAQLNDEQFKKYEVMKENGMEIGDAIDLIFNLRDEFELNNDELLEERLAILNEKKQALEDEMAKVDQELGVIGKLKDTALDFEAKNEVLEKEYAAIDESYEMKVQAQKRGLKWGNMISQFK